MSWEGFARLSPAPATAAAPLRSPGLAGDSKEKSCAIGSLSPAWSRLSAAVSPPSLHLLAAPGPSRSLGLILPFNGLYRLFHTLATTIFLGSPCRAAKLREFLHHVPRGILFFSPFLLLLKVFEQSCHVNINSLGSHARESELCAPDIFCRGGRKSI